jgi:hypothetical protein
VSTRDQCIASTRTGLPCPSPALAESHYCFAHDPALAEKRVEARRRGGQGRANVVRLRRLVPPRLLAVYDTLESALMETYKGTLDARQASAMASLARAMVAVLQSGEMEERLRTLEAKQDEGAKAG